MRVPPFSLDLPPHELRLRYYNDVQRGGEAETVENKEWKLTFGEVRRRYATLATRFRHGLRS